jgi:predicted DNA-binding transcriptional regulator AlpA
MSAERLRIVGSATTDPPSSTGVVRQLWGWPEVEKATGIPKRTLLRWIATKQFPAPVQRPGRRPYWRVEDVMRWINGGR